MSGGGGGGGGIGASIGGIVGGIIGNAQASGDKSKAQGYAEDAYNTLIGIGLPPDLSKEVVLQKFQEAGMLSPEVEHAINLTHSAQANLQEAPETRKAQIEALNTYKQLGATGLGAQDKAALAKIRDQVQSDLEGKRQQILQNMQARGMGGSGAELIAQLQASQAGANTEAQEGLDVAAQAQKRALEILGQQAGLAGQVRSQDYTAAQNRAASEDLMNRFNVQNQLAQQTRNVAARNQAQAGNLANKQNIMNANVSQANREKLRQNQAKQDYWNNLLRRATGQAQGYRGMAGEYANRAQNIAQEQQNLWTGIGGLGEKAYGALSGLGGESAPAGGYTASDTSGSAYSGGAPTKENPMWYSDEKLKKNIHSGKNEVKEFLDNVKPYSYDYKDSNQHNVSPMAQDLEKSSIGKRAVEETPKGKLVDYDKLIQSVVASQGYLNDEIKKLKRHAEPKKAAFGGLVPGEAIMKDNNFLNDTVNADLTPGEIILPREVSQSDNPEDRAYDFVKALLKKKKEGSSKMFDPRAMDQDAVALDESKPENLEEENPTIIKPEDRELPKNPEDMAPIAKKADTEDLKNQIMFGKNDVSTLKALEEAQRQRGSSQDISDIMRASALIGQGVSGIENKGLKEMADIQEKRAGQPIEDFKQKIEVLKRDPNSAVSQGYKALLEKQMGIQLGGDVSAADIEPFLTSSIKKKLGITDYQKAMLDIYGKRLENEKSRLDQADTREQRLQHTQGWREKERDELSDKQADAIGTVDETIGSIEDLAELKPAFDTGPIEGRLASFRAQIGEDEPTRTAFKARVGRSLANYIRAMSGLAVTNQERQFLSTLVPSDLDKDETFMAKVKDFKNELEKLRSRKLLTFKRQGRNTKSFEKESKVKVQKNGKPYMLPKSQLEQAIEEGYEEVE